jgi:hypothetical protein
MAVGHRGRKRRQDTVIAHAGGTRLWDTAVGPDSRKRREHGNRARRSNMCGAPRTAARLGDLTRLRRNAWDTRLVRAGSDTAANPRRRLATRLGGMALRVR